MTDAPDPYLETGRVLFAGTWSFRLGVAHMAQLPAMERLEIAFAGRSNVGKSSLVNALTGRKALAKVSNTPGRTQQLNFFDLGDRLTLVDMPGYGYAKAPLKEVDKWNALMRGYLRGRASLARVYVLVDSRHGVKANDIEMFDLLDTAAVSYQVVLTKTDHPKPTALVKVQDDVRIALAKRPAAHPEILATSSETGAGIPDMRAAVARLMAERGA